MKTIQSFSIGDKIPSNATFITLERTPLKGCPGRTSLNFYYEVPEKIKANTKTLSNYKEEIDQVINYLNQEAGKSFSLKTDKTRKAIFKWLKQGYTVDSFKKAIDNKCNEWLGDPQWEQYLRPETLFGSKFENYYNSSNPGEQVVNDLENIIDKIQ